MRRIKSLLRHARSGVSRLNRSYVIRHPNVRLGKYRPFLHWLFIGIFRGNRYFPKVRPFIEPNRIGFTFGQLAKPEVIAPHSSNSPLPKISPIPSYVLDQISEISIFEPAVLAPGRNSIPWLPIVDSSNLESTTGLVPEKINKLGPEPETILLVPHFVIGGADQYTANLVRSIRNLSLGPIQVIATLENAVFDKEKLSPEIVNSYEGTEVLIWSEVATHGYDNPLVLASYLNATGAKRIINIQSDLGFRVFSKYGLALSQRSKLFAAYFSMDTSVFSKQYGVVYFRSVSAHSVSFSDNLKTIRTLRSLNPKAKLEVIPTIIRESNRNMLRKKPSSRSEAKSIRRLIWVSRVEKAKGTEVLAEIARMMPNVQIDVFGPLQGQSLHDLGLLESNITYRGQIDSIFEMDYAAYDAFIFTSQTEGNPLIVLEMASLGLPIVSTKVGDLARSFTNQEVDFVETSLSISGQATEFVKNLNEISQLNSSDLDSRISRAKEVVTKHHSETNITGEIRRIFEIQN